MPHSTNISQHKYHTAQISGTVDPGACIRRGARHRTSNYNEVQIITRLTGCSRFRSSHGPSGLLLLHNIQPLSHYGSQHSALLVEVRQTTSAPGPRGLSN